MSPGVQPGGAREDAIELHDLVDTTTYPIDRAGSPRALEVIRRFRRQFVETGICALRGFLRPGLAERMAAELTLDRADLFPSRARHNIYQEEHDDPRFDAAHPRNAVMRSDCLCLPYDRIPPDALLRRIYERPELARLVSAIVHGDPEAPRPLHRFADPLGALTVNVLRDGHEIGWHFDQAQFVVILLLQRAQSGGLYEVAPRSHRLADGTRDYALHARVLDESEPAVIRHDFEPGALVVHTGTDALHRVTRVTGDRDRVSALLAYADQPGQTLTPSVRETYYGRTG